MRCGNCRAEVMLGSANCEKCGTSLLSAMTPGVEDDLDLAPAVPPPAPRSPAPPIPPPAPPIPPVRPVASVGSPPPPPVLDPTGFTPPPPPPPGWQQGGPLGPAPKQPSGRRNINVAFVKPKQRSGCGCLLLFLLVFLLPIGGAGFGVYNAIRGAVGDGDVQDEGPLAIGVRGEGGIGSGDTDRWTLPGEEGQFRISVFADGDFDPIVTIRPEGGRQLGRDDDGGVASRDSLLVVTLQAGETYQVDVTGFGDSSGDYDILVERGGTPPAPSPVVVDAGVLPIRLPVTVNVEAGLTTRYRFTGEGREVVITAHGEGDFDPVVTVRDQSGVQLGRDDDGGPAGSRDSRLAIVVPGGTTVFVDIVEFAGRAGSFTVEAQ